MRLHFLLRRKLLFRLHLAVGDQAAPGSLDSIFESLTRAKKKIHPVGVDFFFGGECEIRTHGALPHH